MTNPVILLGTQSNGETLPVQVDATGRLVAEGLQGPPGPSGGAFPLPANPYEGALLGWLNGELSWVGSPPVPIPEKLFGPITSIDASGNFIEFAGEQPEGLGPGVFCYQCNEDGTHFTAGWNTARTTRNSVVALRPQDCYYQGSQSGTGVKPEYLFNGDLDSAFGPYTTNSVPNTLTIEFSPPISGWLGMNYDFRDSTGVVTTDKGDVFNLDYATGTTATLGQVTNVSTLTISTGDASTSNTLLVSALYLDGLILVDTDLSVQWRAQSVLQGAMTGNIVPDYAALTVGKYLYIPEQRVAGWVLYGNDPTSLIDHLRQRRD